MPKPIAPPDKAPLGDHKKHADEVLDYEPYKKVPASGEPRNDDVSPHTKGEKHEPEPR